MHMLLARDLSCLLHPPGYLGLFNPEHKPTAAHNALTLAPLPAVAAWWQVVLWRSAGWVCHRIKLRAHCRQSGRVRAVVSKPQQRSLHL